MKKCFVFLLVFLSLMAIPTLFAIDSLKLNSNLNYRSDSLDVALITGSDAQYGFVAGKPNYVIIYGEGCYNSNEQPPGTVAPDNKDPSQEHLDVILLHLS